MTIEIRRSELERMVQEEIRSGHFQDPEELLTEAMYAWREKYRQGTAPGPSPERSRLAGERIRQLRKGNILPEGLTIRDLINEGRD